MLAKPIDMKTDPSLSCLSGDGAYSEVYKVKRNNDSQIYALKKVSKLHIVNGSFLSKKINLLVSNQINVL